MSRELAIRIPCEIGAWVRQQPGSATQTVLALAKAVWQNRQSIRVHDPGAGDDRLKVRLDPRVLRFIRAATHSRDGTTAIRKLLLWGSESRALPSPSVCASLPHAVPAPPTALVRPEPVTSLPVRRSVAGRPSWMAYRNPRTPEEHEEYRAFLASNMRAYGESWAGVMIPAGSVPAHPSHGMALAQFQPRPPLPSLRESEGPAFELPAPWSRIVEAIPTLVLAIGLPVAMLAGAYFLLKWLSGHASAGKVVASVATTAKVAPTVAAWMPQAAAGLGALFL